MKIFTFPQNSPEWEEIRIGKVTGTSLKRVMSSKWIEYSDEIAAERYSRYREYNEFESEDMVRGRELQPEAIAQYARRKGVEVGDAGFILSTEHEHFGISPDAIYQNTVVEVKCPRLKGHIKTIRTGKIPSEYYWQVIAAFVIDPTIRQVDFVSYCPELVPQPIKIISVSIEQPEILEDVNQAHIALKKFEQRVQQTLSQIQF